MSPSVTTPTGVASTPHFRQMESTSSRSSSEQIANIRSWDSDIIISMGSMPGSLSGTFEMSTSIPHPPRSAVSQVAQVSPAPPKSWSPSRRSFSNISRHTSIRSFSVNGSPTWTLGRFCSEFSSNSWEARTLTPPMPSLPVPEPMRTPTLPGSEACPLMSRSTGITPRHITFTSGFSSYASSK